MPWVEWDYLGKLYSREGLWYTTTKLLKYRSNRINDKTIPETKTTMGCNFAVHRRSMQSVNLILTYFLNPSKVLDNKIYSWFVKTPLVTGESDTMYNWMLITGCEYWIIVLALIDFVCFFSTNTHLPMMSTESVEIDDALYR